VIIVQLTGGLGNQLFQYAFGRTLALKNNSVFKQDLSFFETYEWHEYSLSPFNIIKNFANREEVEALKQQQNKQETSMDMVSRIRRKFLPSAPVVVNEDTLLYNPAYHSIVPPAYLIGYWQSEDYFKEQEELIRKEVMVTIPPSLPNQLLLNEIENSDSISLHIRRGNFVQVDFVNKIHGTCSMEYYEAAIQQMASFSSSPKFFIFSDDIPWAKENLKISYQHVFVDINDAKTDYEDMRLMYKCKHHILANSTFSWWGAWLNPSKHKMVIAPKQWYADEEKNKYTKDIIPPTWNKL
jgi:hypothetical protein